MHMYICRGRGKFRDNSDYINFRKISRYNILIMVQSFQALYSKMPEQSVLRLSDAYESKSEELDLELKIRFVNINPGYNEEMIEKSPTLYQYVKFVDTVRKY